MVVPGLASDNPFLRPISPFPLTFAEVTPERRGSEQPEETTNQVSTITWLLLLILIITVIIIMLVTASSHAMGFL